MLNTQNVRGLSYFNTSVSPPTWTILSRGNQAALLTLIAYQQYYKATHDGTCLTPSDWIQITVGTINDFILSGDRDFYICDNQCSIFGYSGSCSTTINLGSSKHYPSPGLCNTRFVHMTHHTATPMLTPAAPVGLEFPSMPTSGPTADDPVHSTHLPAIHTKNHHQGVQHCPLPVSSDWSLDSGHTVPTTTMAQMYVVAPTNDVEWDFPSLGLCPSSDQELETFPPVVMTSNIDWGPSILDGEEYPLIEQDEILDGEEYPLTGQEENLKAPTTKFHAANLQTCGAPIDIGIVNCVEPPGLRPPPEPPPRTVMDPTYIDYALAYSINITTGVLSSRIFVWSKRS